VAHRVQAFKAGRVAAKRKTQDKPHSVQVALQSLSMQRSLTTRPA
jgi:hypothetical protein